MGASARHVLIVLVGVIWAAGCSGATDDLTDRVASAAPRSDTPSSQTVAPLDRPESSDDEPRDGLDLDGQPVASVDDNAIAGEIHSLVRSVPVGAAVRYAGFDIIVDAVEFGFDPAGFAIAYVPMTITNNAGSESRLQTAVEIDSRGHVAGIDRDLTPEVPSGGTASGAVSIRLDPDSFSFDDAVLFIGRPDRERVQIPLGSVGELIDRLPVAHQAGTTATDEVSTITIDEIVTAWDISEPRGQVEPGSIFLHLTIVLDSTVETAVNDRSIDLIRADGSLVTAEAGTLGQVAIGEPFTIMVSFLVADPPEGDYVLRYTERFDRGVLDVPFTVG